YKSEGMFAGDCHATLCVAFCEAGVFNQPCSGNLVLLRKRRVARHLKVTTRYPFCKFGVLRRVEDRVLKERTGAAAVGIAGSDEHALRRADFEDCIANLGESGSSVA